MAKKEHKGFNLLRDQLQEADKWDKIQNWVNGTARVIVVIVEFVVVVCFGARIYMDRVARNLETRLVENQNQLHALADEETRLRQLQIDLQNYKLLWEGSGEYSKTLENVYGYIPSLENSIKVDLDKGKLSITGTAIRERIGEFEGIIKSSPDYLDTRLERYVADEATDTATDSMGGFTFTASIKNYQRKILVGNENNQPGEVSPTASPTT